MAGESASLDATRTAPGGSRPSRQMTEDPAKRANIPTTAHGSAGPTAKRRVNRAGATKLAVAHENWNVARYRPRNASGLAAAARALEVGAWISSASVKTPVASKR